jgi:predicted pyridoxine 5'-phosphate oxidase superfamily flavin-nucleotide-binding protein
VPSRSAGEQRLQAALGTRDRAEKFYQGQVSSTLNEPMREFIARMEMVWIATADALGHCDCSFRAGPPGFVRVLDDSRLAFPDYRGNGVMASSGNLLENPHIGMWFGDFDEAMIGLHVNGRAEVWFPEQMKAAVPDIPEPDRPGRQPTHWIAVQVEEAYIHCRKHLPRLVSPPVARHWGSDNPVYKGGDFFGVAASRSGDGLAAG